MPIQRWIARAAGGTNHRLKPGLAIMRSRLRMSKTPRSPFTVLIAVIGRGPSPVLFARRFGRFIGFGLAWPIDFAVEYATRTGFSTTNNLCIGRRQLVAENARHAKA